MKTEIALDLIKWLLFVFFKFSGPSEPITLSIPDESNPSPQDECAVNFGCGQESEPLVVKTETADHPLYSATTLPQSVDQGSDVAGTSTGISYGLADGMTWDSSQSYMAPLDFDPTSGTTRVMHWRGYNRRQRMSFACPDCGKVFGKEQRLLIHMRIHSTERPYKYRRRKAFFYGDNKKKKKQQALSQVYISTVIEVNMTEFTLFYPFSFFVLLGSRRVLLFCFVFHIERTYSL